MRTNVTYAGYAAKDVIAINDRNGQAIIAAKGGGFIRRERRPDRRPYGFVLHPHRKLGAAMKAAGFNKEEIAQAVS